VAVVRLHLAGVAARPGCRATGPRLVRPGNRKILGFVVDTTRRPGARALKPVSEVIDPEPQFDEVLWKLGQWISG